MYKAGDKVRFVGTTEAAHPTKQLQLLIKGDIVEIFKVDESLKEITYQTVFGYNQYLGFEDVELIQSETKQECDACVCESFKLAWSGCECGYLKRRREQGLE